MLMALLPLAGWAANLVNTTQYGENGLKYKILTIKKASSDYTVSVSQNVYASNGVTALTIPATVTINVKGNDENSVAIDEAITFKVVEIEANAFQNVKAGKDGKVTSIQIGSNIKKIGANAFDGCENVASITFDANENNMEIGAEAFKGIGITSLDLSPITGKLAAVNKWWDNTAFVAGTTVNNDLTTITLPKKVSKIVADAFAGFTALTTVNFTAATDAEAVNLDIESGAFQETPIVKLDLTNARIKTLNKLFEDNNVTLKKVVMSKYVETLNTNALANCIQLGRAIETGDLGEGLPAAEEAGGVDFSQSKKLKTLRAGSLSNTVVEKYDFSTCWEYNTTTNVYTSFLNFSAENPFVNATTKTNKNLKEVVLPKKEGKVCPVTIIGTTFANCEVLTTITDLESSSITAVVDGAFANDIALTSLTFPKTLATVTGAPFAGCKSLATLNFDATALTQLGNAAGGIITPAIQNFKSYGDEAKTMYWGAGTASVAATEVATTSKVTVVTNSVPGYEGNEYYINNSTAPYELFTDAALTVSAGIWVDDISVATAAVTGTEDLFGDYTYKGAAFDHPLTTLNIILPAATPKKTTLALAINEKAFAGESLTAVNIAKDGIFAGSIAAGAIKLATEADSKVEFGDLGAAATFAAGGIVGPSGTYKADLTVGDIATLTTTFANAIVSNNVGAAIVGEVNETNVIKGIGNAATIKFGEIKVALTAPGALANARLTSIEFIGAIKDAAGTIPEAAFNETVAPNLTTLIWNPSTAPTAVIFDQKAFHTISVGGDANATITFNTTEAVAGKYPSGEADLFNVKFAFTPITPDPKTIEVYASKADDTYFYGKCEFTVRTAIANKTANGAKVQVYSAFVDGAAQNIYMDALAQKDDEFIVEKNQPVIVRVKTPAAADVETAKVGKVTGVKTTVVVAPSDKDHTMRIQYNTATTTYSILNDLKINNDIFSSDYIGTNFIGKAIYAMSNPAKLGYLNWQLVAKSSYLPANSVYVVTDESALATARLNVVWLDGTEDVTGILESISEKAGNNNGAIYNLNGIRVSGTQKGIYIKNGKKFIVK